MKVAIKGVVTGNFPRLDYCWNCKVGYEYIGPKDLAMSCNHCKGPRETIYQTDETTTPAEYEKLREDFLLKLRGGMAVTDRPEPMEPIDFLTMQDTIDEQAEHMLKLEDTIEDLNVVIAQLEADTKTLTEQLEELRDSIGAISDITTKASRI